MNPINIYLLRHGKTLAPAALNGKTDVSVATPIQYAMRDSVMATYQFQHVLTSPLTRCKALADLLVERDPHLTLSEIDALRELDFGHYDGVAYDSLVDDWPKLEAFWQAPAQNTLPGAEPLDLGFARVANAWQHIVHSMEQDTLIIAHGGTIRFILADVLGVDWRNPRWYSTLSIGNQSVTHIQMTRHQQQMFFQVKSVGVTLP